MENSLYQYHALIVCAHRHLSSSLLKHMYQYLGHSNPKPHTYTELNHAYTEMIIFASEWTKNHWLLQPHKYSPFKEKNVLTWVFLNHGLLIYISIYFTQMYSTSICKFRIVFIRDCPQQERSQLAINYSTAKDL